MEKEKMFGLFGKISFIFGIFAIFSFMEYALWLFRWIRLSDSIYLTITSVLGLIAIVFGFFGKKVKSKWGYLGLLLGIITLAISIAIVIYVLWQSSQMIAHPV